MADNTVAQIDQNDKPTLLAYNETTGATEIIRCDSVFDYLEIYGAGSGSNTPVAIDHAKIDANHNSTLLAYNETTGLVECLRCDSSGNLLVLPV